MSEFARAYAALIHYPVLNRRRDVVATSVTNLDIHDIARAARTYGLAGYFIVTPVEPHRWLAQRIISHWEAGWGAEYNPSRKDALSHVRTVADLGEVHEAISADCGQAPIFTATSARRYPNTVTFDALREHFRKPGPPVCLLFGTGYGVHPEVMADCDQILEPIAGGAADGYNHLSVRSAASVIFDRLFSPDRLTEQNRPDSPFGYKE